MTVRRPTTPPGRGGSRFPLRFIATMLALLLVTPASLLTVTACGGVQAQTQAEATGQTPHQEPPYSVTHANDGNVVLQGIPELPGELMDLVRSFGDIRSASLAGWSPDGDGVLILTRFADVNAIHKVSHPGGARRQLTFFSEPIGGAWLRPGDQPRQEVLFTKDRGGDEFYQLHLLDLETLQHRILTDGTSRNTQPIWSPDGSFYTFTSTRRTGRTNDIWLAYPDKTPDEAELILEAPDGASWFVSDISPDGNLLLIGQYISITDSRLHLMDRRTGNMREITVRTPSGDGASNLGFNPVFCPSGEAIYLATDAFGEFNQLAKLDLEILQAHLLTGHISHDVEAFVLDPRGESHTAAFSANQDGISRLHTLDLRSMEVTPVSLPVPEGVMGNLRLSPAGDRVAFTMSTSTTPAEVYTIPLGTQEAQDPTTSGHDQEPVLERWTYSETGTIDPSRFISHQSFNYPTFDLNEQGERRHIPGFLLMPPKQRSEEEGPRTPRPVIVFIHGGPESQYRPRFVSTFQLWALTMGAAVVAPNVRGSSGYGKTFLSLDNGKLREDSVRDIGALLDWIEAHPDLDHTRVALYGGSYGGYMVLASLTHFGDKVRAGTSVVGISNFVTFLENTQGYRRDLRRVEYGDERDPEMRQFLLDISPERNAHRIVSPLFVAHGNNDPRVPASEAEIIVTAMRSADRPVWFMNALDEGHGFAKRQNRDLFQGLQVLFLQKNLFQEEKSLVD